MYIFYTYCLLANQYQAAQISTKYKPLASRLYVIYYANYLVYEYV